MQESAASSPPRPPLFDGWELEQQLRHVRRVLEAERLQSRLRLDGRHPLPGAASDTPWRDAGHFAGNPIADVPSVWSTILSVMAWLCTLLGAVAGACGLALLALGYQASRSELYPYGAAIAIFGQAMLFVGVVTILVIRRAAHHAPPTRSYESSEFSQPAERVPRPMSALRK